MAEEQTCEGCQWFCARWSMDNCQDDPKNGKWGECRIRSPESRGFPTTWGNYWCGDWAQRKRSPKTESCAA